MSEPFRDEMSAALTRAEKLAEENRDLRDELQRLRETAHSVRAQSPDDALATQTLAVLERLESATHVDALAKPAAERADVATLTTAEARLPAPALPPPRTTGVSVRAFVIACLVCLVAGVVFGMLASRG